MKFMESHFWYSKSQRNGILFLFIILFCVQLATYFIDLSNYDVNDRQEFAAIQAKIDSLKNTESSISQYKTYPFNPNFISDFKAYQIGLNTHQIDRLFAYRSKGEFVNSSQEFQKVTGVSDSLLDQISPYFKFPDWSKQKAIKKKKIETPPLATEDLNKATVEDLLKVSGIDLKMAKRIIAYRSMLNGFSTNEQLYEVYYLKKETVMRLLQYYEVIDIPKIKKVNINTASFKELLQLPYLDYNLTKKICQYRDKNLFFQSLQELKKIDSFPIEKFDRIALYLSSE